MRLKPLDRPLPSALRSMYVASDGRYRADGEWCVVWPLERLVDENVRAWGSGTLDRSLIAFGDDGTGDPFCMRVPADDPPAVVRWSVLDHAVVSELPLTRFEIEWLSA